MASLKIPGLEGKYGFIVNGLYFDCEWVPEIIEMMSAKVSEQLPKPRIHQRKSMYYTVNEIAVELRKHPTTITNHIRMGLLKATKPGGGKSWIITEQAYQEYKNNAVI